MPSIDFNVQLQPPMVTFTPCHHASECIQTACLHNNHEDTVITSEDDGRCVLIICAKWNLEVWSWVDQAPKIPSWEV